MAVIFRKQLTVSYLPASSEIPLLAGHAFNDDLALPLSCDIITPKGELNLRRGQDPDAYRALFSAMRASSSHVRIRSL